ncbi:dTDP-4-dehydrorhamnose reductase [uncultured Cohaesibacter sp.]|uniref:dTDP-4-dehydrorhamnose reductase n=1 Tax=uncultured Cohaesibacter sp. TaxID=1002546 RepID=UPI0029C8BFE8|nr:dTDP-4-dehydrorhamnose reductase [uncultured Cohaesibacter sp.]
MTILIVGQTGQVARSLAARSHLHPDLDLRFLSRAELDLSDPERIPDIIQSIRPEVIVNTAAYTAVDKAEDEPKLAETVNAVAPGILASEASKIGAPILHLSTDYVFDGALDRPYEEADPVAPLGVYGRSKRAGEEAVIASNPRFAILRTAWVYSPYGTSFAHTMLRLASERDALSVIDDQWGNPTSALDLADAILAILKGWQTGSDLGMGEIYHFAGGVETTWCGFARSIFKASARLAGPSAHVTAIPSSAYPLKARRPANARLNTGKFEKAFGSALIRQEPVDMDVIAALISRLSQTPSGASRAI